MRKLIVIGLSAVRVIFVASDGIGPDEGKIVELVVPSRLRELALFPEIVTSDGASLQVT